MSAITQFFGRSTLQVQKWSPEILTGAGIAGVVISGVLAARATLKLEAIVDKLDEEKMRINDEAETSDEHKALLFKAHRTFVFDLVKLYGPSVTLGAASLTALVSAQGIMKKRNVALAAAYKGMETAYSNYRKRVADEVGEDKEREIYEGLRINDSEYTEYDGEDGPLTKDGLLDAVSKNRPYARLWGPGNKNYTGNVDYDRMFLQSQQNYANDLLHSRGHIFLNEVYDMLGLDRSKEGSVVGWVEGNGDDVVDFMGLGDRSFDFNRAFENDEDIILDFNVDGVIFDKI